MKVVSIFSHLTLSYRGNKFTTIPSHITKKICNSFELLKRLAKFKNTLTIYLENEFEEDFNVKIIKVQLFNLINLIN